MGLPDCQLLFSFCHFEAVFVLLGYLGSFHLISCKLHGLFWHTGVDGTVPAF